MKPRDIIFQLPFEAIVWTVALVALALTDTGSTHLTLCPLKNAGISFCPGCGLGTSISLFLRGEIMASLQAHPLGICAVFILSFRIVNLTKQSLKQYGKSY
jgi:hypothetical protein